MVLLGRGIENKPECSIRICEKNEPSLMINSERGSTCIDLSILHVFWEAMYSYICTLSHAPKSSRGANPCKMSSLAPSEGQTPAELVKTLPIEQMSSCLTPSNSPKIWSIRSSRTCATTVMSTLLAPLRSRCERCRPALTRLGL